MGQLGVRFSVKQEEFDAVPIRHDRTYRDPHGRGFRGLHQDNEEEAAWNRHRLETMIYEDDVLHRERGETDLADINDTAELRMRLRAVAIRNGIEPDEELIERTIATLQAENERKSDDFDITDEG